MRGCGLVNHMQILTLTCNVNTTLARNARDTNAFAGGEGLRRNHHAGKRWNGIFVQHDTKDVSSSLNGKEGGGQFGVERKQGERELCKFTATCGRLASVGICLC